MITLDELVAFGGPAEGVIVPREKLSGTGAHSWLYPDTILDGGVTKIALREAHYRPLRFAWTSTRTGERLDWSCLVYEPERNEVCYTIAVAMKALVSLCWFLAGGWEEFR